MSRDDLDPQATLSLLRASFDQAFAVPPALDRAVPVRLLAIRVGQDRFAVRIDDLVGLEKQRALLRLPGAATHVRGLMGQRGRLLPVFSLAVLLGCDAAGEEPWLLLCGEDAVGLAFATLEGHFVAPLSDIVSEETLAPGHARAHVRHGGVARPLLDLVSIQDDLRRRAGAAVLDKEK